MDGIFLPTLHTFAMNNIFTGSLGPFRFRIVPKVVMWNPKEVNMDESSMEAEFWHGRIATKRARWRAAGLSPCQRKVAWPLRPGWSPRHSKMNLPPGGASLSPTCAADLLCSEAFYEKSRKSSIWL